MVIKKKNGKWRVCVDFTDLNKTCPKDPFPIPRIDQLVDVIVDHPRMSFLDAFQGYHQIPLASDDQEKTAFVMPTGNNHYKVMPFRLKNARSTYQRMMTACSLLSTRDRSNIILGVPRSNHKELGRFKDNLIKKKLLVKMKNNFFLVIVNKNNSDN